MEHGNLIRVLILNFISSLIIAIVTSDILNAFHLKGGMYLGNLFGLYFLVVYGVNNLVEAHKLPNNYLRFIVAILYILLFDIAFVLIIPFLFGPNAFPPTEYLAMNYSGALFNIALSKEFYLALFAVVMLIFNFLIYRKYKNYVRD
ncbi:MAG: hypothetical protein IJL02_01695 [Methanobrevibacter sp.]|uniref:hypothetical protein n=1 Tax=Methanobrevibacter sp. TaxID=66852 RepID=UPI0025E21721|nr:hypothetical protein [Methanobrevibacter sp.]MBQ6098560.1 hypothetical protein [Methanobrevibacter sp.]